MKITFRDFVVAGITLVLVILLMYYFRNGLPGSSDSKKGDTLSTKQQNTADTLQKKDSLVDKEDSVLVDKNMELSWVLKVSKKDEKLVYWLNNKEDNNWLERLKKLDSTQKVSLKLSGSVTFAEEKAVKKLLEENGVFYVEVE